MDSTLILDYAQALARPRPVWPAELPALQRELRLAGLGLAAMEKSVQLVYEDGLRPTKRRHKLWVKRITGQLHAAYAELEAELARQPLPAGHDSIGQAGSTVAVAWDFTQQMLPQAARPAAHPRLAALAAAAETLPEFLAAPFGAGTVRHSA